MLRILFRILDLKRLGYTGTRVDDNHPGVSGPSGAWISSNRCGSDIFPADWLQMNVWYR